MEHGFDVHIKLIRPTIPHGALTYMHRAQLSNERPARVDHQVQTRMFSNRLYGAAWPLSGVLVILAMGFAALVKKQHDNRAQNKVCAAGSIGSRALTIYSELGGSSR